MENAPPDRGLSKWRMLLYKGIFMLTGDTCLDTFKCVRACVRAWSRVFDLGLGWLC